MFGGELFRSPSGLGSPRRELARRVNKNSAQRLLAMDPGTLKHGKSSLVRPADVCPRGFKHRLARRP